MMSDRVITISVNCEITDRCEEIRYFLDSMARTCKNNILKKYSNSILKNLKAQSATYNKKNTNSLLTNTYSKKGISSSKNFQAIEPVESNIKMEPVEYNIESMNDFFQTFYEENYKEEIENIPSENINDFFTLNNFFEKSNLEYDDFFTLNNFF